MNPVISTIHLPISRTGDMRSVSCLSGSPFSRPPVRPQDRSTADTTYLDKHISKYIGLYAMHLNRSRGIYFNLHRNLRSDLFRDGIRSGGRT